MSARSLAAVLAALWLASARAGAADSSGEGYFAGAGGARIHYRYRGGSGTPVVLVHGRSLASEGFSVWLQSLLPGRPLLALDRRGYAPSADGSDDESLGAADVAAAVDLAAAQSPNGRVGLVAFSLGARYLSAVKDERLSWIALVNPAALPLVSNLTPYEASLAWTLLSQDAVTRGGPQISREIWVRSVAGSIARDLEDRIQKQGAGGALEESLVKSLRSRLKRAAFSETLVAETLLGLFGPETLWEDRRVPVLLAWSSDDELIPQRAYSAFKDRLASTGVLAHEARLPGKHLTPLLSPGPWLARIESFDRVVALGAVSECRPAPVGAIPPPPPLPWFVGPDGPWESLPNGWIEVSYTEAGGSRAVNARHERLRFSLEPKDPDRIARAAREEGSRAFAVEYGNLFYVHWANPHALEYRVRGPEGELAVYRDPAADGIDGDEMACTSRDDKF